MNESAMIESCRNQIAAVLQNRQAFIKDGMGRSIKIGPEREVFIMDPHNLTRRDLEELRDKIVATNQSHFKVELGAHQIEVEQLPIDIAVQGGLEYFISTYLDANQFLAEAAHDNGLLIGTCGINSFLGVSDLPYTGGVVKYEQVPAYYNERRSVKALEWNGVDLNGKPNIATVATSKIPSVLQAFQINIEASSLDEVVWLANMSLMLSAYLESVAGNSFLLDGIDTGCNDIRSEVWGAMFTQHLNGSQQSQSRVGYPRNYFRSIEDYFCRITQFPFILDDRDAALGIAIGMYWKAVKIKILGKPGVGDQCSAVVELRTLPVQPSVEEELGLTFLFLGMLYHAKITERMLIPYELVLKNSETALKQFCLEEGAHRLWSQNAAEHVDAVTAIRTEFDRGVAGLQELGFYHRVSQYTDLIYGRLERRTCPSLELRKHLPERDRKKYSPEEIFSAMKRVGMLN